MNELGSDLTEEEPDPLERVWAALEEGRVPEAEALLGKMPDSVPETWVARAATSVELGNLDSARRWLRRAESDLEATGELDYLWTLGGLHLAEWQPHEAREAFRRLAHLDPSAAVLERLALCEDLDGAYERADRLLAEAAELEPESCAPPLRLSESAFAEVVRSAARDLPAEFQEALNEAEVVVVPMPEKALLGGEFLDVGGPEILGLFTGASHLERDAAPDPELPPRIHLFQRNLERCCLDEEELKQEIRVTLYHELGHLLGFDEQGLDDLSLL